MPSSSQADPLSTFSSPIPSTTVPVADLLPGGSPLKSNGADNDVDIVGIFGNSDQDAVFPGMPGGINFLHCLLLYLYMIKNVIIYFYRYFKTFSLTLQSQLFFM